MEMKWTPEQQKVIELRDRNILVSAAAGSGKTAVLVERILGKLTERSSHRYRSAADRDIYPGSSRRDEGETDGSCGELSGTGSRK